MLSRKSIRLTFELLSDEEIDQFSIHSKREIQFILKGIAKQDSQVALYYGNRETFILTTVLDVDQNGLWLDASQNHKQNELIARSKLIYFVGVHQHVKVQFSAGQIEIDEVDDLEAFFIPLPHSLLRIQRREHFRLSTPGTDPLKCSIPLDPKQPGNRRDYLILDISSGGIALACMENDLDLTEGKTYRDCHISLPDGMINVSIQVKNIFPIIKPTGDILKRAGCKFIDLDGKVEIRLQRYITQLQHSSLL
jgi:c-di-GMP-binding flagellar brake protein YcgR